MPNYMLLLYDSPTAAAEDLSPEEMQRILERYRAWHDRLREEGRLLHSEKLVDGEGRVLRPRGGEVRVLDGPFSETKEVVGGYFAFGAEDYDEAVEIARGCPHLDYGGTLEVRRIEEM